MGELKVEKTLYCLICDAELVINQSYSIFYTFITNSGVLLANSLEKNLLLKDIGSLSLRSNSLCLKCFGYFEQLSVYENKIIQLKGNLWTTYTETCKKHGEKIETYIKGVSTQTDYKIFECKCKTETNLESKSENENKGEEENLIKINSPDLKNEIKIKSEKDGEEITVEADLHFPEDLSSKKQKKPGSCKLCGKGFKKVTELNNHMMVSHLEINSSQLEEDKCSSKIRKKFHSCTVCNKKFRRPCEVKEHMVSHKCAAPYKCKYCGKELKSKTGAIYHTLKTHRIDIGNNKNLDEHFHLGIVKISDTENELHNKNVSSEEKIKHSYETSSSDDELPLAKRRKEFIFEKIKKEVSADNLETFEKKKKISKQAFQTLKKYCNVSVTKMVNSPIEETKNKDSSEKQKFEIEKINDEKLFLKDSELSKNEDSAIPLKSDASDSDEGIQPIQVENIVKKKTKSRAKKYSLNSLVKIKRQKESNLFFPPVKEPKFKCEICGKMWKTRGELNAHVITHSSARPYICEICGQAYKHKPALDVHVGMHRGIYHHQCPYCQKAFTQKGALQRHLPIHTGDLPYQCELCGKRFVHHTSFSMHGLAHTGIRNVKCQICGMGLLSKSHLRRHTRVHTGEKPFSCTVCGKPFAERYNLVVHQRIHDPNLVGPARQQKKKRQTCRLCNATFDRHHKLEDHMVNIHNKVVEDVSRTSVFLPEEGYTGSKILSDGFDGRKSQETRGDGAEESKTCLTGNENIGGDVTAISVSTTQNVNGSGVAGNQNDLSLRSLQSIHSSHVRNLELIRNFESNRNFELIRMTNGIGEMEDSLRIGNSGSIVPWTYLNPGS